MANIDLSKLPPALQKALFEASKNSGQQPTSSGLPMNTPDVQAQQGVGETSAPPAMAAPGSFANDPQGAIQHIGEILKNQATAQAPQPPTTKNYGSQLVEYKGGLARKMPPGILGFSAKVPLSDTHNYYDTLVGAIGKTSADALLPGNTPLDPNGKPFIDDKTLDQLDKFVKIPRPDNSDKPSPSIAKLVIAKLEKTYGKDSPVTQNAKEFAQTNGGIPLSKMSEFLSSSMREETPNFVKGANGLYQMYDRATESFKPVPGQTTGVLEVLNDPASLNVFNASRTRFDNDPVVKNAKASLDLLGNASAILESDNPAAIGVLYSNIAKGVGKDAGALSEGDVGRSVGDPAAAASLWRFYSKHIDFFRGKGQLPDKDIQDFRGLFRDVSSATYKRYQSALDKHVKTTARTIPGLSEDFIRGSYDDVVPFTEAPNRRTPGVATNYDKTEGQTKSGTKYRVIQ